MALDAALAGVRLWVTPPPRAKDARRVVLQGHAGGARKLAARRLSLRAAFRKLFYGTRFGIRVQEKALDLLVNIIISKIGKHDGA
jgi:hypothetical protein